MKNRYGTLLLIGILAIMSQWSCKKSNPTSSVTYPTVTISGTVLDWTTGNPIHGAKVVLVTSSVRDSCTTDSSGLFNPPFVVEVTDSANGVNIKLIVSMSGYNTDTLSIQNVKSDQDPTIKLVQSGTTSSTTALVNGVVKDYASGYPLQGASVVVSLVGTMSSITTMPSSKIIQETEVPSVRNKISNKVFSVSKTQTRKESVSAVVLDSTTTLANGTFALSIPLYGLDSVSTIITVTRSGYLSYQIGKELKNGANDLTPISLYVDTSLTRAVVTGIVSDSLSSNPLQGAIVRVALPNGVVDSGSTLLDGSFSIPVNLNGPSAVSATITIVKAGFVTYQLVETLTKGTNDLGTILLKINVNSTYAIVTGTVLDSASSYPLQGASVSVTLTGTANSSVIMPSSKTSRLTAKQPLKRMGLTKTTDAAAQSLPGNRVSAIVLDSTTTLANGSFAMDINLYGLSSVTATITVSRAGYKTNQISWTLTPGADSLGNIPLGVETGVNIAVVTGTVADSASTYPLQGASVQIALPGGVIDSAKTLLDGTFSINVNLLGVSSVNATVTISYAGYITYQSVQTLTKGVKSLGDILLPVNLMSTYGVIYGRVRDAVSSYPIGGATVVVSLPGGPSGSMELARVSRKARAKMPSSVVVDSTTTQPDGSFVVDFNLYDLDSIGVVFSVTDAGYSTYQDSLTVRRGSNSLGNILMNGPTSSFATVTGTVRDSASTYPLQGAMVLVALPGGVIDSAATSQDGTFSINVNLHGLNSVDVTVTVIYPGYVTKTSTQTLTKGLKSLGDIPLAMNINSAYAIITGVVRDSTTLYPLQGASVVVSLPDTNISTTSSADGSFALAVNLVNLSSLPVPITVVKTGFNTYQVVDTIKKGANPLGNILMTISKASGYAEIAGFVKDGKSGLVLTGAIVTLSSSVRNDSTVTLSDGSYSFSLNLLGLSSVSGTLAFHLSSYRDTTISFAVNVGQTLTEDVSLTPLPTAIIDSTGRGVARSISLISVSHQEISIHGVGRNETSVLVWQVLDSLGVPLDISHRDTVTFTPTGPAVSGSDPAYVTPTMGITDGSGQVSATMNSGTAAGTIQLVAKLTLSSGKVVQSSPVLVTVDGGLPDQAHFELNTAELNLAGYDWSEREELNPPGFTAQAGDKYGNPVAAGTAIYFSTTGGIITAAGQTDEKGHASATLYSGYPLPHTSGLDSTRFGSASDTLLPILDRAFGFPDDPTYFGGGTGYAWVKASTQGDGSVTVADSELILFSATTAPILLNGSPNPIVSDTIHSGGSIVIPVHISDRFGNPLESETGITVTVKMPPIPSGSSGSWSVDASGLPATLGDNLTRGPGSTDFTLVLTGSEIDISLAAAFGITITVSGRNGSATTSISGTLMP